MSRVICSPEVHPYLREHPEDVLSLRWWPELELWIGECPGCKTTLSVAEPECPPEQEAAA